MIKLKIFNIEKNTPVCVIDKEDFKFDLLIGLDTMKSFKLRQNKYLEISQARSDEKPKDRPSDEILNKTDNKTPLFSEHQINWNKAIPIEEFDAKVSHLDNTKRKKIYDLIDKYDSIFAKNQYNIGTVSKYEAHITLSEIKYIAKKPYRCSFEDHKEIEKQVAKLLQHGLIEESCSPFAAPVTMEYKKVSEGKPKEKVRTCIDFRELKKKF
jgi:hypothetical protein